MSDDHRIIVGDCLDPLTGLASLADKSVDHIITDPPYSRDLYTGTRTNKGRPELRHRGRATAIALHSEQIGAIDDILPRVAAEIVRIAKRWAVVFSDVEIAPRWRDEFGDWYVRSGVWVKPDPMPQISADRPGQGFEFATIAHPPTRKRWNGGGRAAVWVHGREQVDRPDHPCPKPLALMEALIRDFTDPGELVVDPFAGSGTTGVACKRLGRRFLGWERNEAWAAAAQKRIDGAREQMTLPAVRQPRPRNGELDLEPSP